MNRKMVCISSERNRLKIFLVQKICIIISYYITNFQQPSLTFDFFMFYFNIYISIYIQLIKQYVHLFQEIISKNVFNQSLRWFKFQYSIYSKELFAMVVVTNRFKIYIQYIYTKQKPPLTPFKLLRDLMSMYMHSPSLPSSFLYVVESEG